MFRDSRAVWLATVCGWVAAVVYFIIGWSETISFSRWEPAGSVKSMLAAMHSNVAGNLVLYSFIFIVSLGALFFLLALGSRLYAGHPTSTVTGLSFLAIPFGLMALSSVWLALGRDFVLLQYQKTQSTALESVLARSAFGIPFMSALIAYFGFWGFVFLGNAFRAQKDSWGLTPWCWISALGFLWSILVLAYGYDQIYAAGEFPRALMIWGDLGIWILPTITMAISASWFWVHSNAIMARPAAMGGAEQRAA